MQLLTMYEITVGDGGEQTLVVVAATEREARDLARSRGRVVSVRATPGPLSVKGNSRVVGEIGTVYV